MKYLLSILFFSIIIIPTKAQTATNWKNYTDMKNVQAVYPSSNGFWAATSGGGFYYNATEKSYKTFHKADGLNGQNITAVTVDKYGKIWFGSAEGVIDIYNPNDNSIKSILDIYNSDKNSKQINELISEGDTIIVSSDFGISLVNTNNLTFYDTFFKFGSFSSNIQVNSVLKQKLFFAATVSGVAIQKSDATNLSAPESWNVYSSVNGLPSDYVNKVLSFNDTLIAATAGGLASFNGTSWQPFVSQLNGNNISDIVSSGNTLYILSNNSIIYSYNNGNLKTDFTQTSQIQKIGYSNSIGLLAATLNGVIIVNDTSSSNSIYPNGPAANQFPSMAVDNNGILWCASGTDVTGKGFYKFDGKTWTNYSTSNTPELISNAFHVVYAAPDNSIYFGNWGNGFIKINKNSITDYTVDNTGMKGIINYPNYLVISGFGVDSKKNLWVLNYGGIDQSPVNMLSPDSVWYHFTIPVTGNQFISQYYNLVVDQYDTKWFSSYDPNRSGLFYFNENKTYTNSNDDVYGFLTTTDGLNTNTINSIVMDQRGDLWVGTSLGVNIISNTESVINGNSSQLSISSVFSLRQQTINCIAVDPINDKWIGTNQGLLLVNSDGTSLLASYNTENSPLLSDQITSIAIDKNTGTVYVGTNNGLTSFQTSAIQPQPSFTKLFMYPSPFVLKDGTNKLTIDGLIKDSQIKIITITGKLVKEFSSPGGRVAYWDGTDLNGNLVNSGIYLVVAYDADGNNVFTGKIAVLHQ